MRKTISGLSIAATLMCAAPMTHAAEQESLTLASPELVAAAGFAAGTTVYVGAPVEAPSEFFGTQPVMTSLAGNSFRGRVSTYAYNTLGASGAPVGAGDASYVSGDTFADAHLDLPSGVVIDNVRWWAVDSVATDMLVFVLQSCLPAGGPGTPTLTTLGSGATTGATGNQSGVITVAANVVDNNSCHYWVRVNFQGGVGLTIQKARVQWHRQVSAAPGAATFADVPTSHPFFRFVEALAAAGITGGCGGGNYCPGAGLTRGEMAVFLSTALGLHFPN